MSIQTSDSYTQNRNQIILTALELMGIQGIGRTASNEDITLTNTLLNMMVKRWQAYGYHLWTKQEGVLFLNPNQGEYYLGNNSTDAMATTETDLRLTQLTGNTAVGATSLTVASTAGFLVGDNIGVVQSDKSIFWTTILTVPTSTTLTMASGLTVAANNLTLVYVFTNKITKPLRIIGMARYRTGFDNGTANSTQIDIPITAIAYDDYQNLPSKTNSGRCYQFTYNPNIVDGKIFLFPRAYNGADRVHFTYERKIEDLLNASDNLDFPDEWIEPIAYQLAIRIAVPFGKMDRAARLLPIASEMLQQALQWDGEITGLEFRIDRY